MIKATNLKRHNKTFVTISPPIHFLSPVWFISLKFLCVLQASLIKFFIMLWPIKQTSDQSYWICFIISANCLGMWDDFRWPETTVYEKASGIRGNLCYS
jgi:hypothetical protein